MALSIDKLTGCKQIANALLTVKNVVLIGHMAPDGDTIGSALALKGICSQISTLKTIDVVIAGEVPSFYRFLPGADLIKKPGDNSLLSRYDLAIGIDVASPDRLGFSEKLFKSCTATAIIDHHGTNPMFSDYNFVDPDASAAGELIYKIVEHLNLKVTDEIATNIYTAILTDTGGFKFNNTSSTALLVCSKMVEAGADPQLIYQYCYENKPLEMLKLHAYCITHTQMSNDKKIIWCYLPRKLLRDFDAMDEHTDGIVELLRLVNTVEIAILFKETMDGNIKVSMRSKNEDISLIAREFNGGGHKLAAGCTFKGIDFEKTARTVITKAQLLTNAKKSKPLDIP